MRAIVVRSYGGPEVLEMMECAVPEPGPGQVLGISALGAVRTRGRFVAVVGGAQPIPLRGITVMNQWIAADGAALSELVRSANHGQLTTRIAETLPLTEAVRAHQLLAKGGLRGRIVLIP
ncbi:zinc-binding dehydrogenase [Nocardia sp. NPDC006630]|uniref:zinc-binding dehydrogenase n=1 Tax=Nocardia sp. NPDC006630 TaxID=3157181 RepID=UPI00339E70BC